MRIFLDSSAYAKRFIEESGSQGIDIICIAADTLGLSILAYPEIISALNRRKREKVLKPKDYKIAKSQLAKEILDIDIMNITHSTLAHTTNLLENNVLRTLDAIHIASALDWQADLFVTSDLKQEKAAKKANLKSKFVR